MRAYIVLPDNLVTEIDRLVGKRRRGRFVVDAVRERLRKERLLQAIREGSGILDPRRHPEWSTPEKVAEWVRALRRTPSVGEKRPGKLSGGL